MSDRKWTVMVYMAGDNNLDAEGKPDLYEMKRVGSNEDVALLAQFDRAGTSNRTHRYFLRHWGESNRLSKDIVDTLPEGNTGRPAELTEFIKWGMEFAPAERYMVIIWAHGTGAFDEDIYYADTRTMRSNMKRHGIMRPTFRNLPPKLMLEHVDPAITADLPLVMSSIAPDDTNKDFLDNVELQKALRDVGETIDILGMDACLMSMAEVCFQLRDSVGVTVASEAEQDLDGWPYAGFLQRLKDDPDMDAKTLANTMIDEYDMKYSEVEDAAATLSACDLSEPLLAKLIKGIKELAELMIERFDSLRDAILLARYRCWENELISSVDLADFCEMLKERTDDEDVIAACTRISAFIREDDHFILSRSTVGHDVRFTTGLGIYFPLSDVSQLYRHLDMIKPGVTSWGDFINLFVADTERT